MILVSPTKPAILRSVEESTVKADYMIGAGYVICKVVAVVISILPPAWSRVSSWNP
jgi:hypothetical protein